jgi:ubiquitin-protein ligase
VEPNANLNLTRAASFTEFVHEVRNARQSHVLFMPQYAEPWKQRILNSTLAAIRNYPDFPEGSRRWDDRVYHPDADGNMRVLSQLWLTGSAPVYLSAVLALVRLLGAAPVSSGLRMAWNDASAMSSALAERKA